jgi:hypothetical protein
MKTKKYSRGPKLKVQEDIGRFLNLVNKEHNIELITEMKV